MSDTSAPNRAAVSEARRKLVLNEQIKASASLANGVAGAMMTAGAVGPIAADVYGITVPQTPYWWQFAAFWVGGGLSVHLFARLVLRGLKP